MLIVGTDENPAVMLGRLGGKSRSKRKQHDETGDSAVDC